MRYVMEKALQQIHTSKTTYSNYEHKILQYYIILVIIVHKITNSRFYLEAIFLAKKLARQHVHDADLTTDEETWKNIKKKCRNICKIFLT